jgi:putative intracellular protease/amidase
VTCYPALHSHLLSGCVFIDQPVVVDGSFITSQGPGTAVEFALTLVGHNWQAKPHAESCRGQCWLAIKGLLTTQSEQA